MSSKFQADGSYKSLHDQHDPSPALAIVKEARRLQKAGVRVKLPKRYSADTLEDLYWLLGDQTKPVRITASQVQELCELGTHLLKDRGRRLKMRLAEKEAVEKFLEQAKLYRR